MCTFRHGTCFGSFLAYNWNGVRNRALGTLRRIATRTTFFELFTQLISKYISDLYKENNDHVHQVSIRILSNEILI